MEIRYTEISDIAIMEQMWNEALDFMRERNLPLWPGFPAELIQREIRERLNFKLCIDESIISFFSVALSDPVIWGEKEIDDAIYIHRGVTSSGYRGINMTRLVLEWAKVKARIMDRKFIRIDTWGSNTKLIEYYESAGFTHIGFKDMGDASGLPSHYKNLRLALFETPVY